MKLFMIIFISSFILGCAEEFHCDKAVLNKYAPKCLHPTEDIDPMCRNSNWEKIKDITAELEENSGSFVSSLTKTEKSQHIFSKIKDKYGVFLLNEAVVLNQLDSFEFMLSQGVNPFHVEGPTSATFTWIITQDNFDFVKIVEKYYPPEKYEDSVNLSKYFYCSSKI